MAYKTKYKSKYIGNPTKIICRSLWERRVCKYLDENKNIIRWGSEEINIPYYSPVDKKVHKYYPDFIVEKKTSKGIETLVIEVKPKKQTMEPERKKKKKSTYIKECMTYSINESKWKAATKLCKEKGWNFVILTEDHILP